jgi:hypothetical protein
MEFTGTTLQLILLDKDGTTTGKWQWLQRKTMIKHPLLPYYPFCITLPAILITNSN